jgi:CubicO group peptidase (beta-lactamase class C family)
MDKMEGVSLGNWRQSPWNRWAFQHVSELIAVAPIAADPGHAVPLPQKPGLPNRLPDGTDLDRALRETETDAFMVVRKGSVVFEWYANGQTPATRHIVFSVSKSISAVLAGILAERGDLDPDLPVTRYIPEAAGSAYGDCTARHVLDMTVSVDFDESYLDPNGAFARYREAMDWNPPRNPKTPGLHDFLITLPRGAEAHGARFHYVSPNSDLLGWIIERASGRGYADLLSELLWRPMGAENDAYVTIDKAGAARSAGGVCTTLRDLARLGELLRCGGRVGDKQVVPQAWIDDMRRNGDRQAWAKGDMAALLPNGRYRSKWYQLGNAHDAYCAIGIHGQWLYVDPAAELVIAKQSSQALPVDDVIDRRLLALFETIAMLGA